MNYLAPSPYRTTQDFWLFWVCRERISLKKGGFSHSDTGKTPVSECVGGSRINGVSRNKDMNHFAPSPYRATQTFGPFWVCRERISLKKAVFRAATQAKHPFQSVSRGSRINGVSREIEDQWCVAKQGHEPLLPIAPSRDTDFPAILGVSREDFLEKRRFSRSDTGKTPVSGCVAGIEDQWCVAGNRRSMVCHGDLGYGAENEEYEESTQSPSRQTITAKSHP